MSSPALEKSTADIERMIREFNIRPIKEIEERFPDKTLIEKGILIAHRDFDEILDLYEKGEKFAIVSGRGPSGPIHLGHLFLFRVVKQLQEIFDVDVFIPLSDDEKLVFNKISSLKEGEIWGLDNAKIIMALGFNPSKTTIYLSSHQDRIYRYALEISRKLTISTAKNALGVEDSANIGILFYSAVQIAHILQPTLDYGYRVVVPIGLDQDVFMRLARDVAEKLGLPKPASLYVQFIPGITHEPMSSSRPETSIYVQDSGKELLSKVFKTLTGGQGTIEDQRIKGANPFKCNIYSWLKGFVFRTIKQDSHHADKCKNGEILCGFDCKMMIYRFLDSYFRELRKRSMEINLDVKDLQLGEK